MASASNEIVLVSDIAIVGKFPVVGKVDDHGSLIGEQVFLRTVLFYGRKYDVRWIKSL